MGPVTCVNIAYSLAQIADNRLEDEQWSGGSDDRQRLTREYRVAEAAYRAGQQHLDSSLYPTALYMLVRLFKKQLGAC